MKLTPTLLYRIAAVALLLFACGHTAGFLTFKPQSPEGLAAMQAMNTVAFDFEGNQRTFGGFYVGFGLGVTAYLVFCAFLAWQLGPLTAVQPRIAARLAWALVAVQAVSLALSLKYFFIVPTIFSAVVVACVAAGALLASRGAPMRPAP